MSELKQRIEQYYQDYLNKPSGQKHLATAEAEAKEVRRVFSDIQAKNASGKDITDDVLQRLLPHHDTEFHRENDYRISTWPCIIKDIRGWFEGAGWKKPEDWQPTAQLLFNAINGIINGDQVAWEQFIDSPYRHGFGTGFITPILFCLDDSFPIINSKVVKTYKYCMAQLGQRDEIDATLAKYLGNAEKVKRLQKNLVPLGLNSLLEFNLFCHFIADKKLGGGDLTKTTTTQADYNAWFFVANPDIFKWEDAFTQGGVDWTGSKGAYAQLLIREQMKKGQRVFGYQAGPYFEVRCEMIVDSNPYRTQDGSWAIRLKPVRMFKQPISLSTLKLHVVLSEIKFVQQTQMSISGLTLKQVTALEGLIERTEDTGNDEIIDISVTEEILSQVDRITKELGEAQYDTINPSRFEKALAEAFAFLGLDTEHIGGPGKADVVATAQLGSNTYTAIIDAKTRQSGHALIDVNFHSIQDHKEENTADYALIIAPAFSGGKIVNHAEQDNVGLVTTTQLINILRNHDLFPFSLVELRDLFEVKGEAKGIEDVLKRVNVKHNALLRLAYETLIIFEDLQRQQIPSQPISGNSMSLLLLNQAKLSGKVPPTLQQIDAVLDFLSNSLVSILVREADGYVLTLSPESAKKRVSVVASILGEEEDV